MGSPAERSAATDAMALGAALLVVALLAAVAAMSSATVGHMVIMVFIWAALATAWNVVGGFAGQISIGHAAFFGAGAYCSSLLYVRYGVSPWLGMLAAMPAGAALSWVVGLAAFRFRGPYFALTTLASGLVLYNLCIYFNAITHGHAGLSIPYKPSFANMIFPGRWPYVVLSGLFLLACLAVSAAILRSRLGYQLAAIRDDEEAARALGVNASRVKLAAATISGAMAGGAGVIYAQYVLYLSPDSVLGLNVSVQALTLAVVGGSGRLLGPLLGSALLIPVSLLVLYQFGVSGLPSVVYGLILTVVVLVLPGGIAELGSRIVAALGRRRKASTPLDARSAGPA